MKNKWDDRLSFLQTFRRRRCNTGYMEFLVRRVWRIK